MKITHRFRKILWRFGYDISRFNHTSHSLARRQRLIQHYQIDTVLDIGANDTLTGVVSAGTLPANWRVEGAGDFNGDGKVDILWRDTNTGTLSIWFTNGTAVTSSLTVGTLSSNWTVAQIGDYNSDGKSDILLIDTAGDVAMWLMNGATVSSAVGVSNVGTTWTAQNVNDN